MIRGSPHLTTDRATRDRRWRTTRSNERFRTEEGRLNREAAQGPKRPAPSKGPEFSSREQYQKARPETRPAGKNSTVQGTYKGAKPGTANVDRVAQGKAAGAAATRDLPKVQGSYAGNKAAGNAKPVSRDAVKKPDARPANAQAKPQARPSGDRGYADNPSRQSQKPEARPQQRTEQKPQMRQQKPEYSQQKPQRSEPRQQKNSYQRPEQRPQQPLALPQGGRRLVQRNAVVEFHKLAALHLVDGKAHAGGVEASRDEDRGQRATSGSER